MTESHKRADNQRCWNTYAPKQLDPTICCKIDGDFSWYQILGQVEPSHGKYAILSGTSYQGSEIGDPKRSWINLYHSQEDYNRAVEHYQSLPEFSE